MNNQITNIFKDAKLITRIQVRLPKLFQIAELESSRAGKIGMEVGSVREKIIIALLMYKFGESNVDSLIPITEAEIDVRVYEQPLSIKTITGKKPTGVKLIWTVDEDKALEFSMKYEPSCDMIFVHIDWSNGGGFYLIPKEVQRDVLKKIGRENYIKLPKKGTNPRGVEMTGSALRELLNQDGIYVIPINWTKEKIDFKPYKRWIELWQED